ncbi:MAG: pseudaminic acid synthase [Rhodospirillales bacterium CG15_BIG_FIL_POST_REV_8_21_14_020_66_15]|nr:MAG: pseudaminic acid synthase [Rhodospirillales bacterium CG15_BIG_FIL_POST_REV_8_21_14_020_66_15]
MRHRITIAGRVVGPGQPPYVIAEMSGNHNGDLDRALALVDMAAEMGADAVKLQTYTADTITIDHDGPGFTVEGGLWDGRTLYDLYEEAHTPWEWHADLFARGRERGITMFSSPFDETAIDFLEELGCPAYKIASFEAMDLPLILKAAATGKPLIISTGMVTPEEIDELMGLLGETGTAQVALLHCVSAYPAPIEASNIRTIPELAARYDAVIGLSDHTPGTAVAVAAVSLGAAIVEKHVCLSRADGGVDSAFSLEPAELGALVADCGNAWAALGEPRIGRQSAAEPSTVFRRSLYAVADIPAGAVLTRKNVRSIRPGYGLAPKHLDGVLGRTAARDIARGTPLSWDLISGPRD